MQVKLKEVKHEEKISKKGKQYTSCSLKTFSEKEKKDIWIGGFGSEITKTWNNGDIVEIDVYKNDAGYWNFEENLVSKASPTELDILKQINDKLDIIIKSNMNTHISKIKSLDVNVQDSASATELTVDDIPF